MMRAMVMRQDNVHMLLRSKNRQWVREASKVLMIGSASGTEMILW
jgi:hypothetical protein